MTKIKICGIINLKDAKDAVKLGADYIGFNFYRKSPRYITPKKAKFIIKHIPKKVKKVGVFVNEKPSKEKEIAKELHLDMIQLHGNECSSHISFLKKKHEKTIKAIRVKDKSSLNSSAAKKADYILLDTPQKGMYGGTGKTFNWSLAKTKKRVFLAGGLNPKNVKTAIKLIKPFAVDVCSGIEKKPGIKDYKKMKLFIKNAK